MTSLCEEHGHRVEERKGEKREGEGEWAWRQGSGGGGGITQKERREWGSKKVGMKKFQKINRILKSIWCQNIKKVKSKITSRPIFDQIFRTILELKFASAQPLFVKSLQTWKEIICSSSEPLQMKFFNFVFSYFGQSNHVSVVVVKKIFCKFELKSLDKNFTTFFCSITLPLASTRWVPLALSTV